MVIQYRYVILQGERERGRERERAVWPLVPNNHVLLLNCLESDVTLPCKFFDSSSVPHEVKLSYRSGSMYTTIMELGPPAA